MVVVAVDVGVEEKGERGGVVEQGKQEEMLCLRLRSRLGLMWDFEY